MLDVIVVLLISTAENLARKTRRKNEEYLGSVLCFNRPLITMIFSFSGHVKAQESYLEMLLATKIKLLAIYIPYIQNIKVHVQDENIKNKQKKKKNHEL